MINFTWVFEEGSSEVVIAELSDIPNKEEREGHLIERYL